MARLEISAKDWEAFRAAVQDRKPIHGRTHKFYRYPARFSPNFARAAIETFSSPGQTILDPYMGGGTTVVEAMVCNRRVVGTDLNSLAVFVARVKTTPLSTSEESAVNAWAATAIPALSYHYPASLLTDILDKQKTRNLHIPRARFLKKIIAVALKMLEDLPSKRTRRFVRCAILQTGQLALDGRRKQTSVEEFRRTLAENIASMLKSLSEFRGEIAESIRPLQNRRLYECNASQLDGLPFFQNDRNRVDLVVTSPPYPGIHMLYHRWQVDGRKETPAPYWMTGCNDGQGESYYNFGGRHQTGLKDYFAESLRTLSSIRKVMRRGALMVQMLAFADPGNHLPRYMENMREAGFAEIDLLLDEKPTHGALWREVPNRKWHASHKGRTNSSQEIVLIHRAQ